MRVRSETVTRARLSGALALLRKRNRPPKGRRIRKLRLLALLAVLSVLGLSSFTFGMLTAIAAQVAGLDPYRQHVQQQNTYVYASDGHTILAVLRGSQARVEDKSLNDISEWMRHAIVAIEDKRFYEHHGIDLRGILRAVWADITQQATVQGGSTITQQFVKNAINGNAPTFARKLKEAALAWKLEQVWPKDRILLAYLNTIYFGNGAYGVEEASRVYFGHTAKTMTPAEAALLAGIPEDPSLYDPVAHPVAARERRNLVLQQMYLQSLHHRAGVPDRDPREDAEPGLGAPAGEPGPGSPVLRQLRDQPARREVRQADLRRRAEGDDDDRPRAAEDRPAGDRDRCCRPRSGRPPRSSRSTSTPATCSRWSGGATTT